MPTLMPAPWPALPLPVAAPPAGSPTAALLYNVQANILKPHGRTNAVLVLWRCNATFKSSPVFWRDVADRITSAGAQQVQIDQKRTQPDSVCINFGLTAKGMNHMGVADLPTVPPAIPQAMVSSQRLASQPFAAFNGVSNPLSPPSTPATPWAGTELHGFWLLACDVEPAAPCFADSLADLRTWCRANGLSILGEEQLIKWRNPNTGLVSEPFGFADGVSGPKFFPDSNGHFPQTRPWSQFSLTQALIGPGISKATSSKHEHEGGSFLIVRKFDQNVAAFRDFESQLRQALVAAGLPAPALNEPGALLIGRFRNGDPLVPTLSADPNDFDFEKDRGASKCPFHAHIRKMNGRTKDAINNRVGLGAESFAKAQLVRRGMVYGNLEDLNNPAGVCSGVGLMFMAFTSDIGQSLGRLEDWAKDAGVPANSGQDPVLATKPAPWIWRPQGGSTISSPTNLPAFISLLGGGNFYVPSLQWLSRQT
jgi:deferrochelatase/peroxidase EfeB